MFTTSKLVIAAAITLVCASRSSAQSWETIPEIEIYGKHFFYADNGSQFHIKGVAYQQNWAPHGKMGKHKKLQDPLTDGKGCRRDVPYLKALGMNVIRVHDIDPNANHDDCMEQLAANHIYVFADLGIPGTHIESRDPKWDVGLYRRYTSAIDAMSKYKNVIGFFAGNEVFWKADQTKTAAYVKAAVRDMKGYIKGMNYRSSLVVGYAGSNDRTTKDSASYFACDADEANSAIDFWGYNLYSWCGNATEHKYHDSGYEEAYNFFKDYPVPVFFSEYGCIDADDGSSLARHRPFSEVEAIYGPMSDVFSGGIVFEYFKDGSKYGLVQLRGDKVKPYPDYTSLSIQLARVAPATTTKSGYIPSNTPPACPAKSDKWKAAAVPLPPHPNSQLCACVADSLDCDIVTNDTHVYGKNFDYICGVNHALCAAIVRDPALGFYGGMSHCEPRDQLAWIANQFYKGANQQNQACYFNGAANIKKPFLHSECKDFVKNIARLGTGYVPSPTGKGDAQVTRLSVVSSGFPRPIYEELGMPLFVVYLCISVMSLGAVVFL
ncbi:uncharacterized protein EI97DRAFT_433910 [Westerdykella ornata]|uniref:1,3-beta-glucanosyltransferase n=1 Tax=Westerdykella ornata TaxID=318751 RepID=A0A6A6JIB8_WESOR|nr:uncharacterized protein EI97DRAFT_433910 [Westerdykella ornata]KAF2275975.1 hypothetical protein EI97DRAFT_433910 [Westerdykella ornata]